MDVVLARDGDAIIARASLNVTASDDYSRAHFPGLLVMPGVFIIDAVCRLVDSALGTSNALCGIESVHFTQVVRPGDQLAITATIAGPKDAKRRVGARCHVASTECARLRLDFEAHVANA